MSIVADLNSHIRRRQYRPTVSGADQAEQAEELQLLNRVRDKLAAAEAQDQAGPTPAVAHLRESPNAKIAELEAELAKAQDTINNLELRAKVNATTVSELKAELERSYKANDELEGRIGRLVQRFQEKSLPAAPKAKAIPVKAIPAVHGALAPHYQKIVRQAAEFAGKAFKTSPDDLLRHVGRGDKMAYSAYYKMARMAFLRALLNSTGISLNQLKNVLRLEGDPAKYIEIHRFIEQRDGFEAKLQGILAELESFVANLLAEREVARC